MTISTDDFISHGTLGDADSASEIELRSGMRSLYYGIYHLVRDLRETLPEHSNGVPRKGSHSILAGFLVDFPAVGTSASPDFARKLRRLGILLDNLRAKRHVSDYELDETISANDYKLQQKNASNSKLLLDAITEMRKSESI